jgi:dipeptidyl aminopeptidase/acylaminoacyl peptidase
MPAVLALGAVACVTALEAGQRFTLEPALVFTSTRDNPNGLGSGSAQERVFAAAEIYMWVTEDGSEAVVDRQTLRLTNNQTGDGFAVLDPTGRKVAFDGLRARAPGEPLQISDLFVLNVDDHDAEVQHVPDAKQAHLTRGSSAAWAPDAKHIAFHASDSGVYTSATLARPDPGTPMLDSDIFVLDVDDCIAYSDECLAKEKAGEPGVLPEFLKNLTKAHGPATMIDEDPDWSPDGQSVVFSRHDGEAADHHNTHSELFLIDTVTGALERLTDNALEERAPAWSPDGTRILFMCRGDNLPGTVLPFQLCVIEKDGQGVWVQRQLTTAGQHLSARWSPDGQYIIFHRPADPLPIPPFFQLFRITFELLPDGTYAGTQLTKLTSPPGFNGFPAWGRVRVRVRE